MSMDPNADRLRELGLKASELPTFSPAVKPNEKFGREPLYNTRVLVDNWYEDRRQYKTLCTRCTGPTIYKADYQPICPDGKGKQFPPYMYQRRLEDVGEGFDLLRNTEDYCPYLQNYTTTYDLMHNWEVRRAGVKPKPWKRWRIGEGIWTPQNDNTVSFGNLTQVGYRKAPQVPLIPNDWDLYADTGYITETKERYPRRKYPEDYEQCRKPKAATREIVKEIQDLTMKRKPVDPCNPCAEASLYTAEVEPLPKCCPCRGRNHSRFGNCMPYGMALQKPAKQTLYLPRQSFPYKALHHPRHAPPEPCAIFKLKESNVPDYCREYAGNTRFDFKGVLGDAATLCK